MTCFELVLMGFAEPLEDAHTRALEVMREHLALTEDEIHRLFDEVPCALARIPDEESVQRTCTALKAAGAKVVVIEREEPTPTVNYQESAAVPRPDSPSAGPPATPSATPPAAQPGKDTTDETAALFYEAVKAFERGEQVHAESLFLRVLTLAPQLYEAHVNLGNIYFESGRLENAISEYEQAILSNPNRVDGHFNLANSLAKLGRLDEAIRSYKEALQVDPQHTGTLKNLAHYRKKRAEQYAGSPPPEPEAQRRLYKQDIFSRDGLAAAKRIILTPERDIDVETRWSTESPAMAKKIGELLAPTPESLILDFGCGVGRIAKELISRFGCGLIGADISPEMLRLAFPYVQDSRFSATFTDQLDTLAAHGCRVDHALAIWVLQHVEDPAKEIARIAAIVNPGGLFFVANAFKRYVPTSHGWLDDKLDIEALVAEHFTEEAAIELTPELLPEHLIAQHYAKLYRRKGDA